MDVFAATLRLREVGAGSVQVAVSKLGKAANQASGDLRRVDAASNALSGTFKRLAAAAGAAIGVRALTGSADAYTRVTNTLRLATASADELSTAYARVFQIAQKTGQPVEDVATLYNRAARSAEMLGLSQQQVAQVTEFVNKAITVSGSSAAAASGAITQLGQALAQGTVRAEEFNSIQEGAPALIQAVEKTLGLQAGQLRLLALEGKLSSQTFVQGMLANKTVAEDFTKTQRTVAQEIVKLRNEFTNLVGKLNETYKITDQVRSLFDWFRNNLPQIIGLITAAATAWLAYNAAVIAAAAYTALLTAAQTIAAFLSLVRTVRSLADAAILVSMATGGWVKLIAAVVAGAGAFAAYKLITNELEKATAKATAELGKLAETQTDTTAPSIDTTTKNVVDQIAALMRLSELMPITRTEANALAREESRLEAALRRGNLTFDDRLKLTERMIAVQDALRNATIRRTREEMISATRPEGFGATLTGPSGAAQRQALTAMPTIPEATKKGIEADAKRIRDRATALVDEAKMSMFDQMESLALELSNRIRDTFVESIANGIQEAIATGSIGEGFKAFGRTLLAGLGSMMIDFGKQVIVAAGLFEGLRVALANAIMNPAALTAVGAAMIAIGAGLRGAAQSIFGGPNTAQSSTPAMGGFMGSTGGGRMPTMVFGPTMAGAAAGSVSAAVPMNVTIIGPNDPTAQRAMQELITKANRRGNV